MSGEEPVSVAVVDRPENVLPIPTPSSPYCRPRKVLGDPTPLACTVAKIALEVVLGGGGLDHLNRWVTPSLRASLARQNALAIRSKRARQAVVRIVRIRVCRMNDVAAETSIVADDGCRVRAIAARFEDVGGRWQATILDIG